MCEAITLGIGTALMGAVSSIAGYQAESAQARASQQNYEEQRRLNAEAANVGYQKAQARLKGSYDQASQQAEQLLVQRLQAQGSTLAAGRSGQSVSTLLTDAQRTEGRDLATLGMNLATDQGDYNWTVNDLYTSQKNANIQAAAQRKAKPSTGGLLMGIGGAALSGVSAGLALKAPSGGNLPGGGKGIANPDITKYISPT